MPTWRCNCEQHPVLALLLRALAGSALGCNGPLQPTACCVCAFAVQLRDKAIRFVSINSAIVIKLQEPLEINKTRCQNQLADVLVVIALSLSTSCMRTTGATCAAASKEQKPADDAADDASSCPELMSDDDPMPALPGMKPASRRFDGVEEADDGTDDEAGSEGAKQSN